MLPKGRNSLVGRRNVVDLFNSSTLRGQQRVSSFQGPPGADGTPGSVTTYSTFAPDNFNGKDGDVHLQVDAAGTVIKAYQKNVGAWFAIGEVNNTNVWIAFNPTASPLSGSFTTFTSAGKYKLLVGKTVTIQMECTVSNNGTGSIAVFMQMPFNTTAQWTFSGIGTSNTVGNKALMVDVAINSHQVLIQNYDGTYPINGTTTLIVSGVYERV